MRKLLGIFLLTLTSLFVVSEFVGCSKNNSNGENNSTVTLTHITDAEFYSSMQRTADRIEVKYDNATGKYFNFTITDSDEIAEVMDILLTETLIDHGDELQPPGSNTSFTVYQGEEAFGVSDLYNTIDGRLYSFSTRDLQTKLFEIATVHGAYEGIE